MGISPSSNGFNFSDYDSELPYKTIKSFNKSNHGSLILAKKPHDDQEFAIQCIQTYLREDIVCKYIEKIKCLNNEYFSTSNTKYYPAYKTFLTVMPYFEKSLETISPINLFNTLESRNQLFRSILETIKNLNSHDLVHGNLKPSNIFILDEGKCIITDYYKYKLLPETFPSNNLLDNSFYSPEIISNKQQTIESDIWSFGCLIYYCCIAKSPFYADSIKEIHENINNSKYKPLANEYNVYNNILSKIFIVDLKNRCSISELSDFNLNNNDLPVPMQGEDDNGREKIFLPSSNMNEIEKVEIYHVKSEDVEVLTSVDMDKIWIQLVYSQWRNDKETMIKYLDYIKSTNDKGFARRNFLCKLIKNIRYLPLLRDYIKEYIIEIDFINEITNSKIHISPYVWKKFVRRCFYINQKDHWNDNESEIEKDYESSITKKRITFSKEIEDIDVQISSPVKLFSIFSSKYATVENSKPFKIPLNYLQQYILSSKYINIHPTKSGLYTSISITPNLPEGLKINKLTGRIHGFHKIEKYFTRKFTVRAVINGEEVNRSAFTLTIVKEKNPMLVENKSSIQSYLCLKYKHNHYSFKVGEEIKEIVPHILCEKTKFSIISEIPPGLKINETTGVISGKLSEYFNEYSLIIQMTNGYESTATELLISSNANGEKNVKEWLIPIHSKKENNIICEINQLISIPIPNVSGIKDKKNLIVEPSLPKEILELNYHSCVINGMSSKPLPKKHYVVSNKETKKVIYEFNLEVRIPASFSYSEGKYAFKIGDTVIIKPYFVIDDKDKNSDNFLVGCNKKLPKGLMLDKYTGSICGVPVEHTWEDTYDIRVQSIIGVKTINLTIFTGEKPKSFKYNDNILNCNSGNIISYVAIFDARCCEFRIVEGELPSGFTLNKWNGSINGVTYCSGVYKIKVRCENMLGYIEQELTIDVSNVYPSAIIYEKNLYEFVINKPIDQIIPKISEKSDYSFNIHSNNLPAGLSIDNKTGVISGTPIEICKSEKIKKTTNTKGEEIELGNKIGRHILIAYRERNSYYSSISLYLHIGKAPQVFKYSDNNEFIIFRNNYFIINPTYDDCKCKFYILNGSLPNGITLNIHDGSIYGRTYDSIKTYNVTVRCKNSFGYADVNLKLDIHEYIIGRFKYDDKCNYLLKNEVIKPIKPIAIPIDGICEIQKSKLPSDLSISKEGIITGTPTTLSVISDYMIYWKTICKTVITSVKISVGIKPNFKLEYKNKGVCKCGFGKEFHYCLLNSPNEVKRADGLFSIEPGIRLNAITGEISGEGQSENDDCHYTVYFDNHFGRISTEVEIISKSVPSPISFPQPYYVFDLDKPMSITSLHYGGNNLIFTVDPPLPEGLSIRSDCGLISGKTPLKPYYQKHRVIASNDYGSSETEILLYFGDPDYFVYYDKVVYYEAKENNIMIKPKICGKKSLPNGLKMSDNCEIIGITKTTMNSTKYTIIQKNNCEYQMNLFLEIGIKPNPVVYEKREYEFTTKSKFKIISKEKNINSKYTVTPKFPEGIQVHPITGMIYGIAIDILAKTEYTIICTNKYGSVKTNVSLTIKKQ